jgi:hypothetical protein
MSVWNGVQHGRVILDGSQQTPENEKGKEHVNEVMKRLADVVYDEPESVGFSAVVSFLAVLLADMNEPLTEVVNTSAVLHALVRMNLAVPDMPHLVYRCEVAE